MSEPKPRFEKTLTGPDLVKALNDAMRRFAPRLHFPEGGVSMEFQFAFTGKGGAIVTVRDGDTLLLGKDISVAITLSDGTVNDEDVRKILAGES